MAIGRFIPLDEARLDCLVTLSFRGSLPMSFSSFSGTVIAFLGFRTAVFSFFLSRSLALSDSLALSLSPSLFGASGDIFESSVPPLKVSLVLSPDYNLYDRSFQFMR